MARSPGNVPDQPPRTGCGRLRGRPDGRSRSNGRPVSPTQLTRRTALLALMSGVLAGCGVNAMPPTGSPLATTPSATPPVALRIGYGPAPAQFGDLYLPAGSVPSSSSLPVVVLLHGGGWKAGSTLDLLTPYARELAARGVAAWNLEYREVGNGGGWPGTFQDAASGVDALAGPVQQAAGNRLDTQPGTRGRPFGRGAPGRVVGRTAEMPSGAPGAAPAVRLTAAVGMAPVLDLEQAVTVDGDRNVVNLLGGTPTEQPDRYAVGSPIRTLPVGVPVTCVHGDADTTVPIARSQHYVTTAQSVGDPARLITLPGGNHHTVSGGKGWELARNAVLDGI